MIIYGIKAKVLLTEAVTEACPNCTTHNLYMNILQRWAHIFWIPFFPIGKTGISQCAHCKQVLKLKQMPATLRLSYDNIKLQTKTPAWTFSGIGVVVIIFIAATILGRQKAEKVTHMTSALKKGNVLHLKLADTVFTLVKVTRVKGDSVFFIGNKYQTDLETGLDDLKAKEYETEERVFTVADLKDMDKKKQILDIENN